MTKITKLIKKNNIKLLFLNYTKNFTWRIFQGLLLFGLCFIILFPLFIKFSTSLMVEQDLLDPTVNWIPYHSNFSSVYYNYLEVIEFMNYQRAIMNSFIFAFGISVIQLIVCTIVGYGFARFDFKGRSIIFAFVIFTLLVPPQMIMIPLFLNFRFFNFIGLFGENGINLLGTYWPFILTALTGMGFRNGLYIYIARQHFKGMPKALEESAYVDGAGQFNTFLKIMLPGAVPILIVIFLFSFVWQWNDTTLTAAYLQEASTLLPFALQKIVGNYEYSSPTYITIIYNIGMILFILPLLIIYIPLQRYFIESVERTGIVG